MRHLVFLSLCPTSYNIGERTRFTEVFSLVTIPDHSGEKELTIGRHTSRLPNKAREDRED